MKKILLIGSVLLLGASHLFAEESKYVQVTTGEYDKGTSNAQVFKALVKSDSSTNIPGVLLMSNGDSKLFLDHSDQKLSFRVEGREKICIGNATIKFEFQPTSDSATSIFTVMEPQISGDTISYSGKVVGNLDINIMYAPLAKSGSGVEKVKVVRVTKISVNGKKLSLHLAGPDLDIVPAYDFNMDEVKNFKCSAS